MLRYTLSSGLGLRDTAVCWAVATPLRSSAETPLNEGKLLRTQGGRRNTKANHSIKRVVVPGSFLHFHEGFHYSRIKAFECKMWFPWTGE